MKPALERDLTIIRDTLEKLKNHNHKTMSEKEYIDFSAKVKVISETAKKIRDKNDEHIKEKMLKGEAGEILGEDFKATVISFPCERFQQKKFSEAHPQLFEDFKETKDEFRLSYGIR